MFNPRVGDLLQRITPEEEVRWELVQMIVDGYAERNPEEIAGCIEYVKKLRKESLNDYALVSDAGGSDRRHMYEIPSKLHQALSMKFPKIFDGDNVIKFLKLYPIFQIPKKL